jgi:hypothetical protein
MGEETDTETITVGEVSAGEKAGALVELPVVDVLTGRSFLTGKSGSGKSNSASVVCEKLLDRGYALLIVDLEGEYYGLKEEYEILHVGADEECDLQINVEHAEKVAELALEKNVPIILDMSSFLDESEARDLLTQVTKQLFAREKKLKQPFLMLVEEVHEYIPEGGGVDECGRMLIKVGKRGRKHGLGIVGISQRPADVKKDFITQCDWLVWHRLTWNNDTKVVSRVLGSDYADEIEGMDDGECFLMTDWNGQVSRVQFERKRTFDAGATPGLDDFERPELKSVSGELLEELQEITESQQRRESRIEELEREVQRKDERIRDLERQLSEAQDLKRMADRFSRAMMEQVTGRPLSAVSGRQSELDEAAEGTENGSIETTDPADPGTGTRTGTGTGTGIEAVDAPLRRDPELEADLEAVRNGEREPQSAPVPDASEEWAASREQTGDDIQRSDDGDPTDFEALSGSAGQPESKSRAPEDSIVRRLRSEIQALDDIEQGMLRRYRERGPMTPQNAYAAAGGSGDRTDAYAANRSLRERGLVEHAARGRHDYALSSLVVEEAADPFAPNDPIPEEKRDRLVAQIETPLLEGSDVGDEEPSTAGDTRDESDAEAWPDP